MLFAELIRISKLTFATEVNSASNCDCYLRKSDDGLPIKEQVTVEVPFVNQKIDLVYSPHLVRYKKQASTNDRPVGCKFSSELLFSALTAQYIIIINWIPIS